MIMFNMIGGLLYDSWIKLMYSNIWSVLFSLILYVETSVLACDTFKIKNAFSQNV